MTSNPGQRPLTDRERAVISVVLAHLSEPEASLLRRQLESARVTGGMPTFLDLEVDVPAARADIADGPLPGRAIVMGDTGELTGEVLVWVTGGYLSGLEFAWYTDQTPTEMPDPTRINVVAD